MKEPSVQYAPCVRVQLDNGADEPTALELPERSPRPSQEEIEEDDVLEPERAKVPELVTGSSKVGQPEPEEGG